MPYIVSFNPDTLRYDIYDVQKCRVMASYFDRDQAFNDAKKRETFRINKKQL